MGCGVASIYRLYIPLLLLLVTRRLGAIVRLYHVGKGWVVNGLMACSLMVPVPPPSTQTSSELGVVGWGGEIFLQSGDARYHCCVIPVLCVHVCVILLAKLANAVPDSSSSCIRACSRPHESATFALHTCFDHARHCCTHTHMCTGGKPYVHVYIYIRVDGTDT